MKPISVTLCVLAVATALGAGSLLLVADPAHAAASLSPAAPAGRAPSFRAPVESERTGLARPVSFIPAGTPLDEEAMAAIRAAAAEVAARERNRTLFDRQLLEGDWLRLLGHEVATSLGLDAAAGQSIATVLVRERDDQSALWAEVRGMKNKRASRERLAEGMQAIVAAKRASLIEAFGADRAASIQALLDDGGPGKDGDPGLLARAGYQPPIR